MEDMNTRNGNSDGVLYLRPTAAQVEAQAGLLDTQSLLEWLTRVAPPRFPLGQVVATPGALRALDHAGQAAFEFLSRHQRGYWGELSDEDMIENEEALRDELRVLSCYRLKSGVKLWIITEADRSVTTLLLPSEN